MYGEPGLYIPPGAVRTIVHGDGWETVYRLGDGYGLGGESGVAIPPQGLNLAGTVQVEERRPGGFVRCR